MKKVLIFAAALLVCASQVSAQLTYDLFYGLPGEAGSMGADVGILNSDIGSIGGATDVPVMIKKSFNDNIEVGARATSFESLVVGGKYKLGESNALSVGILLPLGDVDDPGLAVGYMMSMEAAGLMWNNQLHLGLLDGHTAGTGIFVDILLEPYKELNDKMVGYLDILIGTNTDDIGGDPLGINLGPNVDYLLSDSMAINAGLTIGIAGDAKADDIGLSVTLLTYVR
jgi:hypothetical protein